jgi:hypothetical protein
MWTKRSRIITAVGALIIFAAWLYLHPAWQSTTSIRNSLLCTTPLGTKMPDVRELAKRRGWITEARLDSYGTVVENGALIPISAFFGHLRHDPFPYRTSVGVTWEFNSSNELVNIRVLRYE